jgi:hypothetical protein
LDQTRAGAQGKNRLLNSVHAKDKVLAENLFGSTGKHGANQAFDSCRGDRRSPDSAEVMIYEMLLRQYKEVTKI